jgi:hypothetical protein
MKSLFGNWLLAVVVFTAVCWYFWHKEEKGIDSLAAHYGASAGTPAARS